MQIALITFEQFTDVDVFLPWDLLNRVKRPDWSVRILADAPRVTSRTGLGLEVHGDLAEAREADAVIVTSGDLTRTLSKDAAFLAKLDLDPSRQLIGSMCSGALILGAKGPLPIPLELPVIKAFFVFLVFFMAFRVSETRRLVTVLYP